MARILPFLYAVVAVIYGVLGAINVLDDSPDARRVLGVDAAAAVVMLAIAVRLRLRSPQVAQVQSWIAVLVLIVIAAGSYGLLRNPRPNDTGPLELATLCAGIFLKRGRVFAALCVAAFAGLVGGIAMDPSAAGWPAAVGRFVGFTGSGWLLHIGRARQSARIEELRRENLARAAALDASEERFRMLAENARDVVAVIDAQHRFVYVSPRSLELLGYEPEELLGRRPRILARGPDLNRALHVAPRLWSGSAEILAFHLHRKDGTRVWHEVAARPIERDGERQLVLISRDVTERYALEERLREVQKHESLTVMAGGIAHDFNNLLTVVLGEAELARQAAASGRDAGASLDQIAAAAERAQRLTGQLLAYAGGGPREEETLDVAAQVKSVVDLLHSSLPPQTEVRFAFDAEVPKIRADAAQLQQLIMNLVLNAAESRDSAPVRIDVSVRRKPATADAGAANGNTRERNDAASVVLEVADDGPGIPREHLDRLFDPFFTTKRNGHGLGLAAVLGVARAHGAAIDVDSEPGKGSRFRVSFPPHVELAPDADDALGDASEAADTGAAAACTGRALVVDDNRAVRDVVSRSVAGLGFEPVQAGSGEEAVAFAGRDPSGLQIALVDVSMDGMDGLETRRRLHAIRPELPVLLMTGFDRPGALGPDEEPDVAFLRKPFTQAELAARIQKLMAKAPSQLVQPPGS